MTHAPHFPAGMMHVQLSAAVLDDGRFVASASSAHSRIAAIVAGSSIATTVSLSPDTPCCSSAPSDALVETPFRIPSTDTLGFAAAALAASCLACYPVVDSVDELLDLDQGSWEGSLPDSSSLGEDGTPLRGAFIIDSASLTGFQELTAGKTLSILREWRILIAIDLRQPGPLWSAKLAQSYAAADMAGAKSVIASFWPAADTFTIALMKRLYQHLINGSDKGAALREAKLSWIFSGNSATKPFRSIGPASRLSVTAQQQSSSKHSSARAPFVSEKPLSI